MILGLEKETDENSGIVEMINWIYNFSFIIIGTLALGIDFNDLWIGESHEYIIYSLKYFKGIDWIESLAIYLIVNISSLHDL
jgi:hypothetical protein